jgi:hypothetical protein
MALIKHHHFTFSTMPDHSAGVNSIGRANQRVADNLTAQRAQYPATKWSQKSDAEKQAHRDLIAANRAKALQTPKSKRPGASKDAYDFSLDSECLSGGTYDPKTKDLTLDFVGHSKGSAGSWDYADVPARLVQRLRTGDAGEVFNEQIRDQYEA